MRAMLVLPALAIASLSSAAAGSQPIGVGPGDRLTGALDVGRSVRRTIDSSSTHRWTVDMRANHVAVLVVRQRGVDVNLRVLTPAGVVRRRFDSPLVPYGIQRAAWVADARGPWIIEIQPGRPQPPGDYELTWAVARPATERDREAARAD